MKKLCLSIFLVLIWCNVGFTEDISELQVEGMSIGESLLDHYTKKKNIK